MFLLCYKHPRRQFLLTNVYFKSLAARLKNKESFDKKEIHQLQIDLGDALLALEHA